MRTTHFKRVFTEIYKYTHTSKLFTCKQTRIGFSNGHELKCFYPLRRFIVHTYLNSLREDSLRERIRRTFILTQTREQTKTLPEMKIVEGPFHHPNIFSSQPDSCFFNPLAFDLEGYNPFVILFFVTPLNPDLA